MPVVAAPIFWAAVAGAGATTAQTIYKAKKDKQITNEQVAAQERITQEQAAAEEHATTATTAANEAALAFQRQQAEQAWRQSEIDRRGNYDQWRARENRLGSVLGGALGLPAREIPDYVPSIDPQLATLPGPPGANRATAGSGTPGANGLPTIDPTGDLAAQISAYFKGRGVSDQETSYWVGKWPELIARGQQLGDPSYAARRLSQADIFGGQGLGGGGGAPAAAPASATRAPSPYSAMSIAQATAAYPTYAAPTAAASTAPLRAPTISPVAPRYGSINDYLQARGRTY